MFNVLRSTFNVKYGPLNFFLFLLISVVLLPCQVMGDEFRLVPSATLKEQYNDNVFYTITDRKSDWVTTLSPALELINKTEKLDVGLQARVDLLYFNEQTDLNAVDQFYKGKLYYSPTNRLRLGAEAGYARDSQPDRDIETTGLVLTAIKRERKTFGVSGDWRITDTTLTALSYKYDRDRYDRLYADIESQYVDLNVSRDIYPDTKGRLNVGYARFYVPGSSTTDNYTGTVGISYAFHELWTFLIDAGPRYTRTHFNVPTLYLTPSGYAVGIEERMNDGSGWVGQVAMTYKGERASGSLAAARNIMPASGTTGAASRNSLTLDIRYRFIYELSAFVRAYYFTNKSNPGEFSSRAIDETTTQVVPGLRYEFTRDIALEASYTYSKTKYEQTDTSAERNSFLVSFRIQHALLE